MHLDTLSHHEEQLSILTSSQMKEGVGGIPQGWKEEMREKVRGAIALPPPGSEGEKSGCIEWTKGCDRRGNPVIYHQGMTFSARRFIWSQIGRGGFAENIVHPWQKIQMQCSNPKCVNPNHMILVGRKRKGEVDVRSLVIDLEL